jgi:hypothetical protein
MGDGTGRVSRGTEDLGIDAKDGEVTCPRTILSSPFLRRDSGPHGGPHSINILWAGPTKTDSGARLHSTTRPCYGSHGRPWWRQNQP